MGRWLGLVFVLLMFLGTTYMQLFSSSSTQMIQKLEYQDPKLGNLFELIFGVLIYGYWGYLVGFGRKSRQYFDESYLIKLEQEKVYREEQEKNERI
jgi:hypothetical protein